MVGPEYLEGALDVLMAVVQNRVRQFTRDVAPHVGEGTPCQAGQSVYLPAINRQLSCTIDITPGLFQDPEPEEETVAGGE